MVSCLRKLPRSECDGCVKKDKERGVGGAVRFLLEKGNDDWIRAGARVGLRMWRATLLGYILVWARRGPIDHGIRPKVGSRSLELFSSSLAK